MPEAATSSGSLSVGFGGLGAIGFHAARAIDADPSGLRVAAVAARDGEAARLRVVDFAPRPRIVSCAALADCDVVVEAAPAEIFDAIAAPAIAAGRVLVAASAGALLARPRLIAQARETGARIIVPSGGLGGLDVVRAAALAGPGEARLVTRKPPAALADAPAGLAEPLRLFAGDASEAARRFPANANVAAALALAGWGAEHTQVEIWADPGIERNLHMVEIISDACRMTLTVENLPSPGAARTSRLAALSMLACLRGLVSPLRVGT